MLKITRALIVGCGGTGSYLADPLTRLLSYHSGANAAITFCDGDDFEDRNLERQSTHPSNVNINKAAAMCDEVRERISAADVFYNDDYLSNESFRIWLRDGATAYDSPLIIATVDNDMTRKIMLDVIEDNRDNFENFLFITPGNASGTGTIEGQVFYWGRDENGVIGMNPALVYAALQDPQEPAPTRGSCIANAPSETQLISSNMLAAAWTLSIVQGYLEGTLTPKTHACFFDANKAEVI